MNKIEKLEKIKTEEYNDLFLKKYILVKKLFEKGKNPKINKKLRKLSIISLIIVYVGLDRFFLKDNKMGWIKTFTGGGFFIIHYLDIKKYFKYKTNIPKSFFEEYDKDYWQTSTYEKYEYSVKNPLSFYDIKIYSKNQRKLLLELKNSIDDIYIISDIEIMGIEKKEMENINNKLKKINTAISHKIIEIEKLKIEIKKIQKEQRVENFIKNLKPIKTNIITKKEENFYIQNKVDLYEPRVHRKYKSGFASTNVKVFGKNFRVGGSKGKSISKTEIENIDSGKLSISNKRFIYIGKYKNYDINFNKIINLEFYSDGFQLSISGRQKPLTFLFEDEFYGEILPKFLEKIEN